MVLFAAPDYLPEPPFWAAALRAERIVLLTGVQYARQSRHNRARIRTPQGAQWLTVPIRRGQLGTSIWETEISPAVDWWRHHRKAFQYNYGGAPFYEHYVDGLADLSWDKTLTMGEVSVVLIDHLCYAFGVTADVEIDSTPRPRVPDGGLLVSGEECWEIRIDLGSYRQVFEGFVPGLSAVDLLFNHGPRARDILLRRSSLVSSAMEVPT